MYSFWYPSTIKLRFEFKDMLCSNICRVLVQELSHEGAIFDLHFLPDSPIFAVVTNTGDISVFKFFQTEQNVYKFELISTHHLVDAQITYFSWYPSRETDPPLLAANLETGGVLIVRFKDRSFREVEFVTDDQREFLDLHAHTESAWCCAWVPSNSSEPPSSRTRLFTGGDDCTLRLFSMSTAPTLPNSSLFSNNHEDEDIPDISTATLRPHSSGVTYILPLPITSPDGACILLTGGYDDFIRVYATHDTRKRGRVLTELNLGGGVWRLRLLQNYYYDSSRPNPSSPDNAPVKFRVLASCAYAGARILEIERDESQGWSIRVLGRVTVHQSMCYASDVQPIAMDEKAWDAPRVCVSTSFYDKLLCIWKWDPALAVVEEESRPEG